MHVVTEADIARIPRGNVRVPVEEFARVWAEAEQLGTHDWYGAGVANTCRWMATAIVRPTSGARWYPAPAPVTEHRHTAYEELIQAEYVAADKLDMRRPAWLDLQPGWLDGVRATLQWAWARIGPPPLPVPAADPARA